MERKTIEIWFSNEGSRNEVRSRVINAFLKELPGEGAGELSSRYTYYVETLSDGTRVYLTRPAFLNKAFDFVVRVENTDYGHKGAYKNVPTHNDIKIDLEAKKKESPSEYQVLFSLLEKVYQCHNLTDEDYSSTHFSTGFSPEHILKVIKWLFIEQDIAYWNYSGRNMTWGIIPQPD